MKSCVFNPPACVKNVFVFACSNARGFCLPVCPIPSAAPSVSGPKGYTHSARPRHLIPGCALWEGQGMQMRPRHHPDRRTPPTIWRRALIRCGAAGDAWLPGYAAVARTSRKAQAGNRGREERRRSLFGREEERRAQVRRRRWRPPPGRGGEGVVKPCK